MFSTNMCTARSRTAKDARDTDSNTPLWFDRTDRMGYGGLGSVSVHAERMLVKEGPGQVATSVAFFFHCPRLLKYAAFSFIPHVSLIFLPLNRDNNLSRVHESTFAPTPSAG